MLDHASNPVDREMQPSALYDDDFYAWIRHQAAALRDLAAERWNGPLDLDHLAEEVEDLGDERRNAIRSHLRRIIEHCLKLGYFAAVEPRGGWKAIIANARVEIADRLSRTLRRDAEEQLGRLHSDARRMARIGLVHHGESDAAAALPADPPYTLEQLLIDDWYPASRHGIVDPA